MKLLNGMNGVFTIADDIIVVGCGVTDQIAKCDNEKKLEKLYKRCEEQNIVLNDDKRDVGKEIIFHGHRISDKGVLPDGTKIEAILKMDSPKDISAVRRFCGLVQYMARFLPDLATTLEPIRKLTRKDAEWHWTEDCTYSFQIFKVQLTQSPVLAYFNPDKEAVI